MKRVVRFKDLRYLGLRDAMPLDITKAMGGQGLVKLLGDPGVGNRRRRRFKINARDRNRHLYLKRIHHQTMKLMHTVLGNSGFGRIDHESALVIRARLEALLYGFA